MLNTIVRFSLRFRGTMIALATVLMIYGIYVLTRATYDVFPEFAPPQVFILTEAQGFSPEQVEVLVTRPIENSVSGVQGIESLRSNSVQGLSVITVKFRQDIDIYRARQMVAERLTLLGGQLPKGVRTPLMTPLTSSTSMVLVLGLTSQNRSLMDLRTIADWTIKQRLLAVPGVAGVVVFGGDVKQLQIQVKPDRLVQFRLAIEDVLTAARQATGVRGAGVIDSQNQRIVLQTEGQSLTSAQLARVVVVHQNGANVMLGDVAKVTEAPQSPLGAAAILGHPGVILMVKAQYKANTLEVSQKLERAIEELRPMLKAEGITLHPDVFRPAGFIQTAIRNIVLALEIGGVLVVIVLFLFLFNFRTAAISCTSIPLSLLAAVAVLEYLGFSLNTMILGGLAIAIGEVVDDAVIDVENIFRRLRENRQAKDPRPAIQVILDASIEVRGAVVYATFVVVLVFIPILTLSGVAGRLFAPLGIAYILAVLASLTVALTVTPALCLLLLGRQGLAEKEPPLVRWLKERYQNLLLRVESHPRRVIGGVIMLVAAGLATLPFFGGEFLPQLREGHFIVHIYALPGTSLDESLRLGRQLTLELLKLPYVRSVAQRAGRAEQVEDDIWGTHYSELNVDLKPGSPAELAQSEIRKVLTRFPGISFAVYTFLTERIAETISGYTAPLVINIFGNNLDLLDQKAQEIGNLLRKIPGAIDIRLQSIGTMPQIMIRLRQEDLTRWGFDPVAVLEAAGTAYQGTLVGEIYDGNRVFDVSVILDPGERNAASIGRLPVRSPGGTYIPLQGLADIYETSGRFLISHDGARRVQTVTCNVAGRDTNSFVADAKRRILSNVSLPEGTYVDFSGTAEAQAKSRRDLLIHSMLAGLGIVLILSLAIGNYRNVSLILLNLPFALVGGLLAALASGGWLSLGSIVGFVTVFGITLRNSIMMVSHYKHLVSVEGVTWGPETALRGASERLAPILMTALVTALGLLPLAIGSKAPGREIEGPMAIVILGGLVTSTALNLLVLPTLALRYARFEKEDEKIF